MPYNTSLRSAVIYIALPDTTLRYLALRYLTSHYPTSPHTTLPNILLALYRLTLQYQAPLYITTLNHSLLYRTQPHSTGPYTTLPYFAIQHSTKLERTILSRIPPCLTKLNCGIQDQTERHHTTYRFTLPDNTLCSKSWNYLVQAFL